MYTSLNEYGLAESLDLNTFPPSVVTLEVCTSLSPDSMNTLVTTAPSGKTSPSSESSTTLYTMQLLAWIFRAVTLMSMQPFALHSPVVTWLAMVLLTLPLPILDASTILPPARATPAPSSDACVPPSGILR